MTLGIALAVAYLLLGCITFIGINVIRDIDDFDIFVAALLLWPLIVIYVFCVSIARLIRLTLKRLTRLRQDDVP